MPMALYQELSPRVDRIVLKSNLYEVMEEGAKLLIPRTVLFGMQPRNYFRRSSEKIVMRHLKEEGLQYLLNDPILVCAIPGGNDRNDDINYDYYGCLRLTILEGHHRARYSGRLPEISDVPSLVVSVAKAKAIANSDRTFLVNRGRPFESDEEFVRWAMNGVRDSLRSFSMIEISSSRYEPPGLVSVARFEKFQRF